MTTLVVGSVAVDMTTWAFTPGWKAGAHSATQFVISQQSTGKEDTFTGTGFGGWDSNGFPTLGTITAIQFDQNGANVVNLSDFSMSVADERAFSSAQNMAGFQAAVFSGDDDLTDGALNDHLFALGGNDTFHMTHGGTDIADGGDGNDTFDFANRLDATDQVIGGTGHDTLSLDGNYSGGVTFNATTMTGIETMNFAADHNYSLTLHDGNVAAGATLEVDGSDLGSDDSLDLDGSAETDGQFTFQGGAGDDTFLGAAGGDFFDGGEGNDHMVGNGGTDTVSYAHAEQAVHVDLDAGTASGGAGNDTLASMENVIGSNFNDTLGGDGGANVISGGAGNDVIYGGPGGQVVTDAMVQAPAAGSGNALVNGLGGSAGFGENVLPANDDGSTGAIDITSVFGAAGLSFFGTDYTSLYVNNNGNITFAGPTGEFTPEVIDAGADNPIIAAFWADVDTRGSVGTTSPGGNSTGSDLVWYDLDAANGVFTVTWDDVGYFGNHDDKVNAFQMQLIDRGGGDFDIVFRYEDINWTTGDASGGSGGLGGTPARAGFSAGDGTNYYELAQSGDQAQMLGLENAVGNTGVAGVYEFEVRNGVVIGVGDDDTLNGGTGNDSINGGDGNDVMYGGAGRDHLFGGNGDDRLGGGGQHDVLDGGAGDDVFHFDITHRALGRSDTIVHFNPGEDKIDIAEKVKGLDATSEGTGSIESLASDLGNHHAQLIIQDRDTDIDSARHHARGPDYFIVVDVNGATGYQAGEDLLIQLKSPFDIGSLNVHDFI